MYSETATFDRASEADVRQAVEDAGTMLDVQRHLRLNRTQTRRLLRELDVLGVVETTDLGRSTADANRERRVREAVEAPQSGEGKHCIDCDSSTARFHGRSKASPSCRVRHALTAVEASDPSPGRASRRRVRDD